MSVAIAVLVGLQQRSERELCAAARVVVWDAGGRMGGAVGAGPVLNGHSAAESGVRIVGGRRQQKEVCGWHLLQAAHNLGQAGQVV